MPRTTTLHAVTAIGIDMGKNTLHLIGLDARGAIVLREKVARGRIASRLANLHLRRSLAGCVAAALQRGAHRRDFEGARPWKKHLRKM
jgi:hypothetical protein